MHESLEALNCVCSNPEPEHVTNQTFPSSYHINIQLIRQTVALSHLLSGICMEQGRGRAPETKYHHRTVQLRLGLLYREFLLLCMSLRLWQSCMWELRQRLRNFNFWRSFHFACTYPRSPFAPRGRPLRGRGNSQLLCKIRLQTLHIRLWNVF